MHFSFTLLALLAGTAVAQRACGNVAVPSGLKTEAERLGRLTSLRKNGKNTEDPSDDGTRTLKIKVWYHNIYINRTAEGGYISNDDMHKQHKALNDHYAGTGIYFDLRRTIHTKNATWALHSMDDIQIAQEMKRTLRRGDYGDLNIYLRPLPDYLGWCTFPDDVEPDSDAFWDDGCDVLQTSIPGGPSFPYDEGKTATHEVGHWLGLFHTFQDGCDGGDLVDDTPAEAGPAFGCPVGRDSCSGPTYPGADPIHNFMDYTDDACMNQFSAGQTVRAYQMWDRYRAPWKA
ncbi:Ulilysin [Dactylella cylindrospora]|nr:Ulilysin [Dactylella cylindrospora]